MSQLFVLLVKIILIAMMISIVSLEDANPKFEQDEKSVMIHTKNVTLSRNPKILFKDSPSLFFLHLLKCKHPHYQKLDRVNPTTPRPTTPPPRTCICVPFYLCDANQTIITDGSGIIDVRQSTRQCIGNLEVCCYPRNATRPPTLPPTLPPTVAPTRPPTVLPTVPPTLPPIVLPTVSPSPPVTGFPNLNCICVNRSLCDPNGIVTLSGEGVIDPRQNVLCSGVNQVCCRILIAPTQLPTRPPTIMPTMTLPPSVIRSPGQLPLTDLLGPLKNPNTPQACYCVKTWICSEGNVVSPDGLGVIDPRFTACPSADEVCCRPLGIDLQALRNAASVSRDATNDIERFDIERLSAYHVTCGIRNDTYVSAQPFPADSDKTYFAEFPWMVALLIKSADSTSYTFHCGASMISNSAVLTAAHCVVNRKPEDLVARFGQWNIESNVQPLPSQEANILDIISHPSYYSGGLFHDVAVLILEKPVVYNVNVLPVCLPEQGMVFAAGTRCYGTGWGSGSIGSEYQSELRKVNLPIVDRADCQTRLQNTKLGQYFQLHGSFICAGGETNRDMCRGDGGGPLVCQTSTGQFFQAGIVSWGIGCGTSNVPAVYTSVSQHRQWIDQQLATYVSKILRHRNFVFQEHAGFSAEIPGKSKWQGQHAREMVPRVHSWNGNEQWQYQEGKWGESMINARSRDSLWMYGRNHRGPPLRAVLIACVAAPGGRCSSVAPCIPFWCLDRVLGIPVRTMRQLVSALTLVSLAMVAALPAAQEDKGLTGLIEAAFPETKGTSPQPLPEINGDIDSLIQDVFNTGNVTSTTSRNLILGTQNQTPSKPDDCECVPYYQCKDGTILDNGVGIIDIRSGFGDKDGEPKGGLGPCENYLDVCCKPPDRQAPATPPPIGRIGCGQRHAAGVGFRITGQTDNETQFGEFPWMVAILKEEAIGADGQKLNVYQCGGALIHRQAVLTAAHCVNGKQPHELKIRAGEWDTKTKNEIYPHQDRDVDRVVVHENFHSGALYNDYAILFLKNPVEYAENVDIVCLPEANAIFDGSRCFASGWGKDVFGKEGRYQVILKKVELPVVPHNICQNVLRTTRLGRYFVLDQSFICAGGEAGRDTCKGDGGSPLVCPLRNDPQRYVQAGIVAWGLGCGESGTPGVYANIAHSRRWIDEQMAFYNLDNTVYQYPN
ncbi:hypothetical protein DMN91_004901 [Ooceraea biroi]|uniref:Phenoloxidase-activating factor 2 n=1 Tax=Ooceraea biroi TaxID=2015173 RepID=A0A3L8DR09_OOCBI|nr:hypothetical protein DMN91_004901 [Ooceraea biroi]